MPERPRAILIEPPDMPGYDELPETLAARQALPARFHIPIWDDALTQPVWLCAVCWDEGECSRWPCATAAKHGSEVFATGTELARYKAALGDPVTPPRQPAPAARRTRTSGDHPTVALCTLQFAHGAADDFAVHLVRQNGRQGTPGPTLCGVDRFAADAPGWSVGGGTSGPAIVHKPCPGCATAAREQFSGLPVTGSVGGKEMAAELGVEWRRH